MTALFEYSGSLACTSNVLTTVLTPRWVSSSDGIKLDSLLVILIQISVVVLVVVVVVLFWFFGGFVVLIFSVLYIHDHTFPGP